MNNTCQRCNGRGAVEVRTQLTERSYHLQDEECPECHGKPLPEPAEEADAEEPDTELYDKG
jgi:hypothetical protein